MDPAKHTGLDPDSSNPRNKQGYSGLDRFRKIFMDSDSYRRWIHIRTRIGGATVKGKGGTFGLKCLIFRC